MNFWKSGGEASVGKLQVVGGEGRSGGGGGRIPTSKLASSFLLGSSISHKILLGGDSNSPLKNKTQSKGSGEKNEVVEISSFQANHHRVVSGSITPRSSIVKVKSFCSEKDLEAGLKLSSSSSKNSSKESLIEIVSQDSLKLNKFEVMLTNPNCDLAELKKLSWSGVPKVHRSLVWKLLLNYVPPSLVRREEVLGRKRDEYFTYRSQFFPTPHSALHLNLEQSRQLEEETWHQISIDVPRTFANLAWLQKAKVHRFLERVLYCWAIRHPASGYVQGINDLVIPFFSVFLSDHIPQGVGLEEFEVESLEDTVWDCIEADTFWCFSKLMDGIQDNYTFAQRGIQRQLKLLSYLITRIDAGLAQHLEKEKVDYIQFAFRWINCLLMREFQLEQIIRLWDTYLSEGIHGFNTFHVYVCAAFLVKWSPQIIQLEFNELIMFLQDLKTECWQDKDIELLLAQAYMWQSIFKDTSPSSLP